VTEDTTMAKKSKNSAKEKNKEKYYSDYPIKSLFQIAMLAASISFILYYTSNIGVIDALFKSFLVFIAFSIAGGLIIIVVFSILSSIKQQEYNEMMALKNIEKDEQTAAQHLSAGQVHETQKLP
jgi:sorbitol-specific phosphotransferase system component IIBC